jgi:ABC-type sugar transport system permease subunit
MDKTSLVARNVKAFVVSWLTASLLFPLLIQITQGDNSYLFGVVMMLVGIVVPHMSIPALLIVVLFNWIVLRNRRLCNHVLALLLLGDCWREVYSASSTGVQRAGPDQIGYWNRIHGTWGSNLRILLPPLGSRKAALQTFHLNRGTFK